MMENLGLIVKICLMGWIIVEHPLFGVISELINDLLNKNKNELLTYIITAPFNCLKCSTLYVGLIAILITGCQWWIPLLASFIMKVYDEKFNFIKIN
jgi:ABC-type enterochelin transport system permease subunit